MLDLETRRLFAAASIALRYPERDWLRSFEEIERDLDNFSPETKEVLWDLISFFGSKSLMELQEDYVATFDRKRRACLYMSYYLNGDTRKRGMALLNFKHIYAAEGWESISEELDDYLPILLEFIAVTASPLGMNLLIEHKAGLTLLTYALRDMKSPYKGLIEELNKRIPGEMTTQTLQLIQSGPPKEEVGLEGYGQKVGA